MFVQLLTDVICECSKCKINMVGKSWYNDKSKEFLCYNCKNIEMVKQEAKNQSLKTNLTVYVCMMEGSVFYCVANEINKIKIEEYKKIIIGYCMSGVYYHVRGGHVCLK